MKKGYIFIKSNKDYGIVKFQGKKRSRIFLINNKEEPFVMATIIRSKELNTLQLHNKDLHKKMPTPLEDESAYIAEIETTEFLELAKMLAEKPQIGKALIEKLNYSLLMLG